MVLMNIRMGWRDAALRSMYARLWSSKIPEDAKRKVADESQSQASKPKVLKELQDSETKIDKAWSP